VSSPSPAHRLGPHVVGQRVVIRRLVPGETGPTGGPAFTDVLGVCTAWGDSSCVVSADDGPVEIPLALIVSGKPVPPRPSVRMRVMPRDAELHTASLFPTVAVTALGEWQLRVETRPQGRRLLKRANSCLAMGAPGLPVADALAAVSAFYRSHDRRPLVQVEADSAVEASIAGAGWTPLPEGESAYLVASVAQLARRLDARSETRVILPWEASEDGEMTRVSVSTAEARGIAVLDGDWVGIHTLAVDPAYRRRGLATQVIATLVAWAAERGARTVWLHVETDNEAARALYDSLGFSEHHRCRYLAPAGYADPAAGSRS